MFAAFCAALAIALLVCATAIVPAQAQPDFSDSQKDPAKDRADGPETPPDAPEGDTPDSEPEDQSDGDAGGATSGNTLDDAVAQSLFERAQALFTQGDYRSAKMLLIESLRRSPRGAHASDALTLLRAVNRKLGQSDLDHGAPSGVGQGGSSGSTSTTGDPMDPYGESTDPLNGKPPGEGYGEPVDPYGEWIKKPGGEKPGGDQPESPADDGKALPDGESEDDIDDLSTRHADTSGGRRTLLVYGGLAGFVTGLALAGPQDDSGNVGGGAFLVGAALSAAGVVGAHYLTKRRPYSDGQAAMVSSTGAWGALALGFFADLTTGIDTSSTNSIYKGVALGSLAGAGGGLFLANRYEPSVGDLSLVNSAGLYGMVGGLLIGVAMDPTESEAYSINALLGSAVGLGAGLIAAKRLEVSRRRMLWVDIGAAVGAAAPWILIYPVIAGDDDPENTGLSGAAQAAGAISLGGMVAGAYLAWRFTRNMDRQEDIGRKQLARAPPPALVQRAADGTWAMGVPFLRPAENPSLSQPTSKLSLGANLFSGRW